LCSLAASLHFGAAAAAGSLSPGPVVLPPARQLIRTCMAARVRTRIGLSASFLDGWAPDTSFLLLQIISHTPWCDTARHTAAYEAPYEEKPAEYFLPRD
jgi:hypothetical protein